MNRKRRQRRLRRLAQRPPALEQRLRQRLQRRLHFARDVLFFFPRDYQDLTDMRSIAELEEDKLLSVRGVVADPQRIVVCSGTAQALVLLARIVGKCSREKSSTGEADRLAWMT